MGLNESLKTKEARSARRRGYYMQAKANEKARTTVEKNHGKTTVDVKNRKKWNRMALLKKSKAL
jgi:hypothetical protein